MISVSETGIRLSFLKFAFDDFDHRCQKYSNNPEASDIHNEAFWQSLSGLFKATREMLRESAEEPGIDPDPTDFEETSRDEAIKDKQDRKWIHTA